MPKFILKLKVTNNSGVSVSAHVGASLVGVDNQIEYYNRLMTSKNCSWLGIPPFKGILTQTWVLIKNMTSSWLYGRVRKTSEKVSSMQILL